MTGKRQYDPNDLPPFTGDPVTERARVKALLAADPWGEPHTGRDFFAYREPMRYAAGFLFELPGLNIVYGSPGCFKSFAMMDLAACIVAGRPWLEPLSEEGQGLPTTQGAVLWIDQDQGTRRMDDRFAALYRAYELPPDVPLFAWSMPGFNASDPESVAGLVKRSKDREAVFIGIDNLGTISGGFDENSSAMIKVMAGLRRLAEETGAAVAVIHHQNKAPKVPGQRLGDSLRGHSSIEASLDCALLFDRKGQADHFDAQTTKSRGMDAPPFRSAFTYELQDDGHTLETARFYGVEADYDQSAYAIDQAILTILQEKGSMNKTILKAAVRKAHSHTDRERIADRLAALVAAGKLIVLTGPNNSKMYEIVK